MSVMMKVNSPVLDVLNGWMFCPPTCSVPLKSCVWFFDGELIPPQAPRTPARPRNHKVAAVARNDMWELSHTSARSGAPPGSGGLGTSPGCYTAPHGHIE